MPDAITIKSLTQADRDDMIRLDQAAFGFDDRELDAENDTKVVEWDRAFGAWRGDELAGIYVVFSFGLMVPGRAPEAAVEIPMAGLSWVAVHPDHRRRGVLGAMMRHHLDTVRHGDRGETISGLFASENVIYGRYGYGRATYSRRLTLPAKAKLMPLRDPANVTTRLEPATPEKHDAIVRAVYDEERRQRPGLTVRPEAHWTRHLQDPVSRRPGGHEGLKIVVAERDGRPTGYAAVRRKASWGERGPEGSVSVQALHAVDSATAYALWQRVLDFDLMAEVTTPGLPLDHPLHTWAEELPVGTTTTHGLWIRLVDVPGALAVRGYSDELDVVLEVTDHTCPWNAGRWRLTTGPEGARCEPTTDSADLALDARQLGAAYLGGVTLAALGAAGLVDERTRGALVASSAAFRSALLPATPYMF